MPLRFLRTVFLIAACCALAACTSAQEEGRDTGAADAGGTTEEVQSERSSGTTAGSDIRTQEVDLSEYFEGVEGTFVLYEPAHELRRVHNPDRAEERYTPASTFKIPNSLIALETGVASGPEFTIAWDSAANPPEAWWPDAWRQDQNLRGALQNSVVWYYQEIARRIGEERMRRYVRQFDYGNADIGGGIDQFWLTGDLRISPYEQVAFLERMLSGTLDVSPRSVQIVKDMMLLGAPNAEVEDGQANQRDDDPAYRLYGKTGTANLDSGQALAWLVGFVELNERKQEGGGIAYYALNIEGDRIWEDWGPQRRISLVRQLLAELKES